MLSLNPELVLARSATPVSLSISDVTITIAPGRPGLFHSRFAYVAVSRGALDVEIFINRAGNLEKRLGRDVPKTAALDLLRRFGASWRSPCGRNRRCPMLRRVSSSLYDLH
jgi:hypothetical protein